MKLPTPLLSLSLVLALGSLAAGDVLHLNNGRRLEGRVVSQRAGSISLEVRGGVLQIPASMVRRVERKQTPREEYAARARRTNMNDTAQVEGLALWASRRGLGERAKELRRLANGQRLEAKVAAARASKRARDFFEAEEWARLRGFSPDVQRYLLEQALELDPRYVPAQRALEALDRSEASAEQADDPLAIPSADAADLKPRAPQKKKRVAELERRLSQQQSETEALRKRLQQLEEQRNQQLRSNRVTRLRLRRARRRGGCAKPGIYVGPFRVGDLPDAQVQASGGCPQTPRRACQPTQSRTSTPRTSSPRTSP